MAESRESPDWTMEDLDKALAKLKNNKSRDFEGYLNEIFKLDVIGDNLKESILLMINMLKRKQLIPIFLNYCNITTVPKKGSKTELKNERGIFRVPILRYILMRVIYNTKYNVIDRNMSDCQMGARKAKGCRNNIFKSKKVCVVGGCVNPFYCFLFVETRPLALDLDWDQAEQKE